MDIAIVGVAVALSFEGEGGVCRKARIALGAVAPTPVRAKESGSVDPRKEIERHFCCHDRRRKFLAKSAPISDVRGSAGYRSEMISKLIVRGDPGL